jgi:hypothetical protein
MFKKLILIAALGLFSVAFAGTEDWNGVFTVQDSFKILMVDYKP